MNNKDNKNYIFSPYFFLLSAILFLSLAASFLVIIPGEALAQTIINNQAQATYKDSVNKQYGPVNSNTVSVTKTSSSPTTFTLSFTKEGLSNQQGQVILRAFLASNSQLVKEITVSVDTTGTNSTISNPVELISGQTYNFVLKAPYALTKKISNRQWPLTQPLSFGVALSGNLNNTDDIINSLDWSIMNGKWRTSDLVADINKDGIVNTVDWGFMNKNWFAIGEQ